MLAVLIVLCMAPAAFADTLVSLPGDAAGEPGEQVVVCLSINPVNNMEAADIDIAYDGRVLDAVSLAKTSLLGAFSMTYNIEDEGWIRISLFATQPPPPGGGCAVNITFDTLQAGCSLLDITKASINEGGIPVTVSNGLFTVHDTIDRDGDGYSESGGDCSDRFDWIHPGRNRGLQRCGRRL